MGERISDDDLRQIAKAATPGPWSTMGSCVMASGSCDTYSGSVLGAIAYASSLHETDGEGRNWWAGGDQEANARLISLAPALAAEVLQLREALTFYADPQRNGYEIEIGDYGLSMRTGAIIKDEGDIARDGLTGCQSNG